MQAEEYESPTVSVISIEPDERLMEDQGFRDPDNLEEYGYEGVGFSGGEAAGVTTADKSGS